MIPCDSQTVLRVMSDSPSPRSCGSDSPSKRSLDLNSQFNAVADSQNVVEPEPDSQGFPSPSAGSLFGRLDNGQHTESDASDASITGKTRPLVISAAWIPRRAVRTPYVEEEPPLEEGVYAIQRVLQADNDHRFNLNVKAVGVYDAGTVLLHVCVIGALVGRQLKALIRDMEGYACEIMRLEYNDRPVRDYETLASHGMEHNSCVVLTIRVPYSTETGWSQCAQGLRIPGIIDDTAVQGPSAKRARSKEAAA